MRATSVQTKSRVAEGMERYGKCLQLMEPQNPRQFGQRASLEAVRLNGIWCAEYSN